MSNDTIYKYACSDFSTGQYVFSDTDFSVYIYIYDSLIDSLVVPTDDDAFLYLCVFFGGFLSEDLSSRRHIVYRNLISNYGKYMLYCSAQWFWGQDLSVHPISLVIYMLKILITKITQFIKLERKQFFVSCSFHHRAIEV